MRLLVACPQCKRQFDAAGRSIGSRFRCHCGAAVTVRKPLGHNAAVVRCSSCGAPREDQSADCRYCGADFTLHERDLDTVCPGCLARVSDRAKFCHHCGLALIPEPLALKKTSLICPTCGKMSRLNDRKVGDTSLLECGRCAGFWVATDVFDHLIKKASQDGLGFHWTQQAGPRRDRNADPFEQPGRLYRQCPFCGKLMYRRNYARRSGVIIDACREHGFWFDADELPSVLEWVRKGNLAKLKRQEADQAERKKHLHQMMQLNRPPVTHTRVYPVSSGHAPLMDALAIVARLFT